MEILSLCSGYAETNTYIVTNKFNETIVIDPCLDVNEDASRLLKMLSKKNLIAILLTHGHFDHISGVDVLVDKYHCPVYIHKTDKQLLYDEHKNLSSMSPYTFTVNSSVELLPIGDFKVSSFEIEVVETFGHTQGSVSFIMGKNCFDGDFIFKGSVGRTDLRFGNGRVMFDYLQRFMDKYKSKELILYPGHGPKTTLQNEIETNPYLA